MEDTYRLQIDVPHSFPEAVPVVTEMGGRISRSDPDAHVNPDGSLCLGSPLRLTLIANQEPSVLAFFDSCVVPALYNATHRARHGGRIPLGELAHGPEGELADYAEMFGVQTHRQALAALHLAGTKRRDANKQPCPCGCGRRLGVCQTNEGLRHVRDAVGRPHARRLAARLEREIAFVESFS